ncbi:hypothetical protein FF100_36435 [Methylobacterium terricola]|uniref:Uncharacterized protein n=1 Tax=Methylobacterium terricola TaxID=2583531 RepID=A0A5C4L5F6_9HYPH|nr:hypothetical protein [Methylobacterium terricola]TNC04641.1 hypothetical protein FF100_36435 [Methylobacterium terricola]
MPTTAARKTQDSATITSGLLALLTALHGAPAGSPAASAYTAALRRRGEDLSAIGGRDALHEARAAAIAASPDHAAAIDAAWSTIPGWTT